MKSAVDVVTCVSAFSTSSDTTKVVYLNEISDRPSSYFFHFSRKGGDDAPALKDKSNRDKMVSVKKHGSTHGIVVKTKVLTSNKIPLDVCTMANSHNTNLILIGIDGDAERNVADMAGSSSGTGVLRRSLTSFMTTQIGNFLGWDSTAASAVTAAKEHVAATLGVFIHRGAGLSTVHRIVFPYANQAHEKAALDLLLTINQSVHVDIYTPDVSQLVSINSTDYPHISVIASNEPFAAAYEASKGSLEAFTLAICAADRSGSNQPVHEFLERLTISLLMVYGPTGKRRSTGRLTEEIETPTAEV